MRILGIDTSGKVASVAVTDGGLLLGEHTIYTNRTHSQVILPMCKALLEECGLTVQELDCLAVAVGPGSYTGLRIGIAAVQGMALASGVGCIGISTLEALAGRLPFAPAVLPLLHARADLFYAALFRRDAEGLQRVTEDALLTVPEIAALLTEDTVLTGEGAEEFAAQYTGTSLAFAPKLFRMQSAAGICLCAEKKRPGTAAELTASYLQAVQIQKKKTDR